MFIFLGLILTADSIRYSAPYFIPLNGLLILG